MSQLADIADGKFSVFYEIASPSGASKRYGLIDEDRKININLVKSPQVLRRLFKEACGMGDDESAALVDTILDWRDSDDDTAPLGAEKRYYQGLTPAYAPRNGKFATLGELRWVKGMTAEIYTKIRSYITLDSAGLVNLNTASAPVLAAVGFSKALCDKIVTFRNGRDGLEGTPDDRSFEDLSSAVQLLANASYLDNNAKNNLYNFDSSGIGFAGFLGKNRQNYLLYLSVF